MCLRRRGTALTRAAAVAEAPTQTVFERQYKLGGKHELKVRDCTA